MHKRTGLAVIALLSITATFATGLIANADETSANNDITITAPAGGTNLIAPTVDGRTFKAIRIAGYKNVAVKEGKITSFDLTPADGVTDSALTTAILAAYPSGVESVFTVTGEKITLQGAYKNMTLIQFIGQYFYGNGSDVYGNTNADSEAVRKLADSLMGSLSSNPAITATGSDGKVVIDVPDNLEGLYLIVETTPNTGEERGETQTISRAMLTGTGATVDGDIYTQVSTKHGDTDVTYTLGALNLKAEKVTLDKTVEHPDQLIQIGTSRQFTITTNVPNYQNYQKDYPAWTPTTFQFTDNPSDNIDPFNTDGKVRNLKLQSNKNGGTTWTDMDASEYTQAKNTTTEDSNDFIVALTPAALIAHQGERIKLTYDGVITSLKMDTADDKAHTTLNTVNLDFSNNPNVADDKVRLTDDVNLYDVKLDIEKTDMENRKLLGAKFDVTVDGTKIKFIKSANGDQYTAVKAGSAQDANSVDSISVGYDDNGTVKPVTINGLAADNSGATVYTFTETQAPEGYILGANPVKFTVTLTPKDANSDGTVDGVDAAVIARTFGNFVVNGTSNTNALVSGHEFNVGQVTVKNTKNISDLPQTGGTISKAIGAALATGAFATLLIVGVKLRRKQMSDENGSTSSMA